MKPIAVCIIVTLMAMTLLTSIWSLVVTAENYKLIDEKQSLSDEIIQCRQDFHHYMNGVEEARDHQSL